MSAEFGASVSPATVSAYFSTPHVEPSLVVGEVTPTLVQAMVPAATALLRAAASTVTGVPLLVCAAWWCGYMGAATYGLCPSPQVAAVAQELCVREGVSYVVVAVQCASYPLGSGANLCVMVMLQLGTVVRQRHDPRTSSRRPGACPYRLLAYR